MKRVLVTGASGFIGSQVTPLLVSSGYQVHVVLTKKNTQIFSREISPHYVDLMNKKEVFSLLNKVKPSHLLHLAWYADPPHFWFSAENMEWVKASLELMKSFTDIGGERLVMAGTCGEYDWSFEHCSEVFTPCKPSTLYGVCKHSTQILLDGWAKQNKFSSAWGRIFFLYGPNERLNRLVPSVVNSLLNEEMALCTHGDQIRDFMHVEDVAAAFVALLSSDVKGVVNIASGIPVRVKDIVYQISDQLDRRKLIRLGAIPSNPSEPSVLTADISRLRDEVNFRPRYNLVEGLKQSIDYIQKTRI